MIRYRGRYVRVRTADGIHLNVSGTAIAAKVIAAEIAQGADGQREALVHAVRDAAARCVPPARRCR